MASRTKKLLEKLGVCVFCGGVNAATTRDHQPPKIYFREKVFPKGYDNFPACEGCNNGFSGAEHLAAYFVRIFDVDDAAYSEEDTRKFFEFIRLNFPELTPNEIHRANDIRRALRAMGRRKPSNEFARDVPIVSFDHDVSGICEPSFRKITKALYFKHMNRIAPPIGAVQVISEFNIGVSDRFLERQFLNILSSSEVAKPHKHTPAANFRYKWDYNKEQRVFGCLMQFGSACHVMGALVEDSALVKHHIRHPWHSVLEEAPDVTELLESNRLETSPHGT